MEADAVPVPDSEPPKNTYQPMWPSWATFAARLQSFRATRRWTEEKVRQLAAAGFFYSGSKDTVRCFYCSLALAGWQGTDNPIREHGRHNRQCDYYVDNVVLPCVYRTAGAKPCGQPEACAFCRWEKDAIEQRSNDRYMID